MRVSKVTHRNQNASQSGEQSIGPDWSGQAEGPELGVSSGRQAWRLSPGEASCGAEDGL